MATAFLDTNVFLYAAGAGHPLKKPSQRILRLAARKELAATTNTEVVQEILYVLSRRGEGEKARRLAPNVLQLFPGMLPVTGDDMASACQLSGRFPNLPVRDAVHAATMVNNGLRTIITGCR